MDTPASRTGTGDPEPGAPGPGARAALAGPAEDAEEAVPAEELPCEEASAEETPAEAVPADEAPGEEPGDVTDDDDTAVTPPVVAVLVTSDPGPWLEDALGSLAAQEYGALSVLVLDNGSVEDPTPRIAAAMPNAYVRRLPENLGFAAAANEALRTVEGAPFLVFCHDDVVLAPDSVAVMVEEAYRSNAGIVGPKLVDYDRPEVLLEVGMAVDHYGVPFSGIEPGELDQEQHDAVRDVFFVSTAVMLVRTDLFHELDGFDPATFPGFDDVDLCWRARLAGARVLVAPDARVRHRRATLQDARPTPRDDRVDLRTWTRGRVRVLVKSYSAPALVWVLPVAFALSLAEAAAFVVTRRPGRAGAVMSGWFQNVRELGALRRARAGAQRVRRVDDGDVRDLMVRGSARIRSFLAHRLHAGDRLAEMSTRTRDAVTHAGTRVRGGHVATAGLVAFLVLVGSRSLVLDRVPEVGTLRAWPGAGTLWGTFFAPWRDAMMGADAAAPPVFALFALVSSLLLGDSDLARTLVVVGSFPLGAWGAFRLTRPLASSPLPAVVAALAYASNPVARNAIGEGHIGTVVCYGLAPFVLAALLRASGARDRRAALHATLVVATLTAVAAAVWPPAFFYALLVGVAFLLAVPFAGGRRLALRTMGSAALATVAAAVLLAPWSFGLLGSQAAVSDLVARPALSLADVLAFQTGRAGSGIGPWGLIVAGLLPLALCTGARLAWATRAWMLTVASWTVAWLPARIDADIPMPAREGLLVPAALGLALAVGLGVASFVDELRTFHFGWRQLAAVTAAVGLALPVAGLAADAVQGRWGLGRDDWSGRFAWMADDAAAGGFRVLWLGDPTILPLDAHVVDGVGYGVTRDGPGDVRASWAPPRNDAERELGRAIALVREGRSVRFGHLLGPAGVRYVVVVHRAAPTSGRTAPADERLLGALEEQLDLSISRVEESAVVYENEAWAATRTLVAPDVAVPTGSADPLAAATRGRLVGDPVVGPRSGSAPTGPGTLVWAEAAHPGWRARVDGTALDRTDAYGWTNAFAVPERGSVAVSFDAGARRLVSFFQLLLWIAAAGLWWRGRTRRVEGAA